MARSKSDGVIFQGLDDELDRSEIQEPSPKTYRLLNRTIQTLYLASKTGTIILTPGSIVDLGEEYVKDNRHLTVMVQRGHISLFQY